METCNAVMEQGEKKGKIEGFNEDVIELGARWKTLANKNKELNKLLIKYQNKRKNC